MNSSPSPYLNVTRLQSTQRGTSRTSSCSTFTHSTSPMPIGERERLGLGERRGRVPAAVLLPDHGRVQAFLDRRPDAERRREVVAGDHEVRAVAHADLVDAAEQVIGGVPREHVGRAGLDPDPAERQEALLLPRLLHRELVVTELLADEFVGPVRVALRERHRHVEVLRTRLERPFEDRHHEPRVGGVQDVRDPVRTDAFRHVGRARGVDGRGAEPPAVTVTVDHALGARCVEVGEHDLFVEVTPRRDRGERSTHAARANHQDLHADRRLSSGCGGSLASRSVAPSGRAALRVRDGQPVWIWIQSMSPVK